MSNGEYYLSLQTVESLSKLYTNPDEVDLFIGGISETPLPSAVLGPVFVCIVGDQFSRLRRGDRFFYEEVTARFTEGTAPLFHLI